MGAKGKIYPYRPPRPVELAKLVTERCEEHALRFAKRRGHDVTVTRHGWQQSGSYVFKIFGQSPKQWQELLRAFREKYGDEEAEKLKLSGIGRMHSLDDRRYGYYIRAALYTHPDFHIEVKVEGDAPEELLRCLEPTFNELLEEFSL